MSNLEEYTDLRDSATQPANAILFQSMLAMPTFIREGSTVLSPPSTIVETNNEAKMLETQMANLAENSMTDDSDEEDSDENDQQQQLDESLVSLDNDDNTSSRIRIYLRVRPIDTVASNYQFENNRMMVTSIATNKRTGRPMQVWR